VGEDRANAYAGSAWGPLPPASYKAGEALLPLALRGYAEPLDSAAFAEAQAKRRSAERRAAQQRAAGQTPRESSAGGLSSNGSVRGGRAREPVARSSSSGSGGGGCNDGGGSGGEEEDNNDAGDGDVWTEPGELFVCEALTRADFRKEAEQQRYRDATVVLVMRDDIGDIKLARLTQVDV